jgi:hypothetical protein
MNSIDPLPGSRFATLRYTPRDWDEVRMAFSSSILVDTSLNSLAQNLEGVDWPLQGPDETPAAYIDLSFDEMRECLALRGQPPLVADHLIGILKETLAFDDPFGEMVTQSETVIAEENPLVKNLEKLHIPANFPIALTTLAPETLLFCRLENITTLGEFALAAQRMAGTVIVGGDFRALLNALSNVDDRTLARYLPFRPGAKGIHYIEGLAQGVCAQPVAIQAALARRLKQALPEAAQELARSVSDAQITRAKEELNLHAGVLRGFCQEEYAEIQRQIATGMSPRRVVAVLGDPVIEAVVADLISPPAEPKPGLGARLLRWFKH